MRYNRQNDQRNVVIFLGGQAAAIAVALTLIYFEKPTQAQAPNYIGFIDVKTCGKVDGWAADWNRLNQPLNVSLYAEGSTLSTVTASISRPDVGAFLKDNGRHGYTLPMPLDLQDGRPHVYTVRYEQSATVLGTFTQTCGSIPITASIMRAGQGMMIVANPAGYTEVAIDGGQVPIWGSLNQTIPCWKGELAPDPAGQGIYVCTSGPANWRRIKFE